MDMRLVVHLRKLLARVRVKPKESLIKYKRRRTH
jgi:hypothetical protein